MLTTYLQTPQPLESYRAEPAGPHLDAFLGWLEERGYQRRRISHLLRGAHRFSRWAHSAGFQVHDLDARAREAYGQHLQGLQRLRYPSGRFSHLFVGARHLSTFLTTRGLVAPVAVKLQHPSEPELLEAFRVWMRTHRGTTEATLNGYRLPILALLHTLGEQPEHCTATALRTFVLDHARKQGIGGAKTVVTAVRMFVRFLTAIGRCTPGLDQALPPIAQRVAELLTLPLTAVTFHPTPVVRVLGKGRRERSLPLWNQTADDLRAWCAVRGEVRVPELFLNAQGRVMTREGFAYVLRKYVRSAAHRCPSLEGKSVSPHVLRHPCAMMILQATGDLRKVSLWLGHADMQTTEVYLRADPTDKLEAIEAVVPPMLRRGQFTVPDKFIALLHRK